MKTIEIILSRLISFQAQKHCAMFKDQHTLINRALAIVSVNNMS